MGLNFYDYHDLSQNFGVRKHLLHSVGTGVQKDILNVHYEH